MNKRGFTLVELLSTITLMTVVAAIASFNIIKIFDEKEEENIKNVDNIIETAACTYIELSRNSLLKEKCLSVGCDISTSDLIDIGLVDEEDVSNSKVIHIEKINYKKVCNIREG